MVNWICDQSKKRSHAGRRNRGRIVTGLRGKAGKAHRQMGDNPTKVPVVVTVFSGHPHQFLKPKASQAISRWLSEATPPNAQDSICITPEGLQRLASLRDVRLFRGGGPVVSFVPISTTG